MSPGDFADVELLILKRAIDVVGNGALQIMKTYLRWADRAEYAKHRQLIAWPSCAEVAAEIGMHKTFVMEQRQHLVVSGLLTRLPGQANASAIYEINPMETREDRERAREAWRKRRQRKTERDYASQERRRLAEVEQLLTKLNGHLYREG
jgi:hypothetical protein